MFNLVWHGLYCFSTEKTSLKIKLRYFWLVMIVESFPVRSRYRPNAKVGMPCVSVIPPAVYPSTKYSYFLSKWIGRTIVPLPSSSKHGTLLPPKMKGKTYNFITVIVWLPLATEQPVAEEWSLAGVPPQMRSQVRRFAVHLVAARNVTHMLLLTIQKTTAKNILYYYKCGNL